MPWHRVVHLSGLKDVACGPQGWPLVALSSALLPVTKKSYFLKFVPFQAIIPFVVYVNAWRLLLLLYVSLYLGGTKYMPPWLHGVTTSHW